MSVLLATVAVLVVTFAVPIVVYGIASNVAELTAPTRLALPAFMSTVALEKLGVAVAFVGVLAIGGQKLQDEWLGYGALWFVMFATSEIAEVLRRSQGMAEAAAGIVSEALYCPLASLVAGLILS